MRYDRSMAIAERTPKPTSEWFRVTEPNRLQWGEGGIIIEGMMEEPHG